MTDNTAPPLNTPWGRRDSAEKLADGVWFVTTASHGGVWLSPERRKRVPHCVAAVNFQGARHRTWWEEDCDVWWIYVLFDDLAGVTEHQKAGARRILGNFQPDALEKFYRLEPCGECGAWTKKNQAGVIDARGYTPLCAGCLAANTKTPA